MATEAEIEAAARAIFDLDRSNSGRRRPHWDKELPELRDYVRSKARAALDAAASVRASNMDREALGLIVREAWIKWARTQPAPKPSWLVPYDELSESDKEADRQIGEAVAASVRAEEGTAGMEIVRAVAKLRPDLLRAWTTDTSGLCGLTPDHVRQARAIVAAERKEVMPSGTRQAQDSIDTAPPTAGPIPVAGARRWRHKKRGSTYVEIGRARLQTTPPNTLADYDEMVIYRSEADGSLWCRDRSEFEDGRFECLAPQPPAPAEGAPDVAGLVERWRRYMELPFELQRVREIGDAMADALAAQAAEIASLQWERKQLRAAAQQIQEQSDAQAAALAAKDAEIWSLREAVAHAIHDPAEVLGCTPDNEAIMEAIDTLKTRSAALEAALQVIAGLKPAADNLMGNAVIARAALAGKDTRPSVPAVDHRCDDGPADRSTDTAED